MKIRMTVNGMAVALEVEPYRTLSEVLRGRLELLGVREGCATGECGACTVLLNGRPVVSCLVLAPDADGAEVTTIEGLAKGGKLDPVQEAFIRVGAIQCGYCTPGMVLLAKGGDDPEGNLCRCTGYAKIWEAVRERDRQANPEA